MKYCIIIAALFFSLSASAQQSDSKPPAKDDLRGFMEDFYRNDSFLRKLRFVNTPGTFQISSIADHIAKYKLLQDADLVYFEQQLASNKQVVFDSSYISDARFIDQKDFEAVFSPEKADSLKQDCWEIFHARYGLGYISTSLALFTLDKKLCIVYVEYSIGWMGGSGELRVYQKKSGRWKLYKTIALWDS